MYISIQYQWSCSLKTSCLFENINEQMASWRLRTTAESMGKRLWWRLKEGKITEHHLKYTLQPINWQWKDDKITVINYERPAKSPILTLEQPQIFTAIWFWPWGGNDKKNSFHTIVESTRSLKLTGLHAKKHI